MTFKRLKISTLLLATLLGTIQNVQASCFEKCDQGSAAPVNTSNYQNGVNNFQDSGNQNLKGNFKNTVMGDVNVNVGHKNLSIGDVGRDSRINNSISATVIVGDLNK